jgi:hypothetical protein
MPKARLSPEFCAEPSRPTAGRPSDRAADQFELLLNLNTAKAIGLAISPTFLARTDEAVE